MSSHIVRGMRVILEGPADKKELVLRAMESSSSKGLLWAQGCRDGTIHLKWGKSGWPWGPDEEDMWITQTYRGGGPPW